MRTPCWRASTSPRSAGIRRSRSVRCSRRTSTTSTRSSKRHTNTRRKASTRTTSCSSSWTGKSILLEEYARDQIAAEEMHLADIRKMMRKPVRSSNRLTIAGGGASRSRKRSDHSSGVSASCLIGAPPRGRRRLAASSASSSRRSAPRDRRAARSRARRAKFSMADGLQKQKPSGGAPGARGAASAPSSCARLPGATVEYTACVCTRRRCAERRDRGEVLGLTQRGIAGRIEHVRAGRNRRRIDHRLREFAHAAVRGESPR